MTGKNHNVHNAEDGIMETMFENMKLTEDDSFDDLIQKAVNKRIRLIVLKTIGILACIAALLILVMNPLMNITNIDPYKLNQSENGTGRLYKMLDAWIETQYPYCELDYINVERKGFGNYEMEAHIIDLKEAVRIGQTPNIRFTMSRGHLQIDMNTSPVLVLAQDFSRTDAERSIEKDREAISQLPDSAWVIAAVSEEEPQPVSELRKAGSDSFSADWAEIYVPEGSLNLGINLRHVIANDPEGIREDLNGKELKQLYLNRLELLLTEENLFTSAFGLYTPSSDGVIVYSASAADDLVRRLMEEVQKSEELFSQYYYVSASKDSLLKWIDSHALRSVKIIDASVFRRS